MKIKKIFSTVFSILKVTFKRWWDRDPFSQSEVIAYNAIFSLPGLLVVVLAITGYFWGQEAVSGKLHQEVAQTMGVNTADQIQSIVLFANKSKDSIWATIIGIGIIVFGATRVLQYNWSESLLFFFQILNFIISLGIISILFALMFKFLPDIKIKWSTVWVGGFITSVLFVIGKTGLAFYLGTADPGSGYGAAGSIILILVWTSYSSMIVFFGAEFTKAYSDFIQGRIPQLKKNPKVITIKKRP